jgi:hypothetical protein
VRVRSGGFFDGDDPPETPPTSTMIAILIAVVSVTFAVLVLLARLFLLAPG